LKAQRGARHERKAVLPTLATDRWAKEICVKIGITLPNQVRNLSADVLPRWAVTAEEAGFSTLGTVGRFAYPGVSDTVALAAAAGATSTIGLLSHVLLAPVWPPQLLAKEVAGIDGVSGGRLTLGIGIGGREDDFVVDGFGPRGLGKRLDHDLQIYRNIWKGEPVGGGTNPAVPAGTREVPMLFGGFADAAMQRMAREGIGYVSGTVPAPMTAEAFLGDDQKGRTNVHDYYSSAGEEFANLASSILSGSPDAVKATVSAFEETGADELIFCPGVADLDEVARLADVVL
jgi:alkanesulfonate monooxygenase SsuD/methylene tetrahydromethanopterin reductase-like flavin-dependent oxidoreductase (luciferase family)